MRKQITDKLAKSDLTIDSLSIHTAEKVDHVFTNQDLEDALFNNPDKLRDILIQYPENKKDMDYYFHLGLVDEEILKIVSPIF